ncbi:MAG: hypothetical protein QOD72_1388, partial [Acidimicrobiaceae bacterium]|nr:hypothetical protein [Acidimicrobiaceae bacterium]
VVIPTRNRADLLPRAIDSVLAQDVSPLEVVIVDDGSTDDTQAVLAAMTDPRIRALRQEHGGCSQARNLGARSAKGAVVAFLDDDDVVDTTWLGALVRPFGEDPEIALVSCASIHRRPDGTLLEVSPVRDLGPAFDHLRAKFDTGMYAVRQDAFEIAGGFADGLTSGEHTELGLRLAEVLGARGWRSAVVEEPLVTVYQRPSAARSANWPRHQYDSAMYFLDHHHERLARRPHLLADYLAIAGVAAARLGHFDRARKLLAQAVRAEPRRLKHYGRWLLAVVPPLGRRVWRADLWRELSSSS